MKRFIVLAVTGGVIGMLIFTFLFYNEPEFRPAYRSVILLSGVTGAILSFLVVGISALIARWTHWQMQPGVSLLISLVLNTLMVFGVTSLYLYLCHFLFTGLPTPEGMYIKLAILSFIVVLLYSVAYLVINSYRYLHKSMLESVRLEARQADLQLASLKSRLTPHFLFNSLNTISSLIYRDPGVTAKYVRNLAKIYQYTLPAYNKKLVPFEEEWAYVQANLELLKVRYGNALTVDLENMPAFAEVSMPPLTLQLLIENALKHNRIGREDPLKVVISRNGSWWQVTNNITEKPNQVTSFRVGLRIIRERYELLGGSIQVIRENSFTVKLPVL